MEALAAAGANSVRTWSTDGAGDILDEAPRHGLTVTVGIWLGHERHGFDYGNAEAVARDTVLRGRIDAEPAQALRLRLATTALEWRIEEGVIHISE